MPRKVVLRTGRAPTRARTAPMAWAEDEVVDSGEPGIRPQAAGLQPWDLAPVGLALVDPHGVVGAVNAHGRELLRHTDPGAVLARVVADGLVGAERERSVEYTVEGQTRLLSCRLSSAPSGGVLVFRDVTRAQQRQRRVAAVASAAASVASERSLTASLSAMAREVVAADGLAGVQILTADPEADDGLRVMGTAGFVSSPRFFELLMACRERGASLRMIEAFESGEAVVVPHRYDAVMGDPAWEPLHEILRHPRWDSFASVPLTAVGRRIGILNAFFTPGQVVDDDAMGFLHTMADQAALAIDYAQLLEQQRHDAGRAERARLAGELHDSIVQQVFSIGMQTEAVKLLAVRAADDSWDRVRAVAGELEEMTRSVLVDLRNLVTQLHPASPTLEGLGVALRELVESTRRRTGIETSLSCPPVLDDLDDDLAEDVYFASPAEAVHNAVKHAAATGLVTIAPELSSAGTVVLVRLRRRSRRLRCGARRGRWLAGGYGLTSNEGAGRALGGIPARSAPLAEHGTRVAALVCHSCTGGSPRDDRSGRGEPRRRADPRGSSPSSSSTTTRSSAVASRAYFERLDDIEVVGGGGRRPGRPREAGRPRGATVPRPDVVLHGPRDAPDGRHRHARRDRRRHPAIARRHDDELRGDSAGCTPPSRRRRQPATCSRTPVPPRWRQPVRAAVNDESLHRPCGGPGPHPRDGSPPAAGSPP